MCNLERFSPRAWGWSELARVGVAVAAVLPTRVGMVRSAPPRASGSRCSPHARGDGPLVHARAHLQRLFSPRAWGWSELRPQIIATLLVLPTRVGMVRPSPTASR